MLETLLRRLLEGICLLLMVGLATVVVVAVVFRYAGSSLAWYDEVASVMLAWLTYYGAALAALRRAHLGFPNLVSSLSPAPRLALLVISETLVIGFFVVLGWYGWQVVTLLWGDTLTSLPWVPISFTQSVIPVGSALFVIAELFTLPAKFREAAAGRRLLDPELEQENIVP